MDPEVDSQFREIARERTERHPLRTYLKVPFLRTLAIWFTPRVELLPVSGRIWPLRVEWEEDRADLLVTLSLVATNAFYLALAIWGAWLARDRAGVGRCSSCLFWCARFSFRYTWKRPSRATCWNVSRL